MHTAEMSFRISRNHALECAAADQLKPSTHINPRGKISLLLPLRLRRERSHRRECSLPYAFPALHTALRDQVPVDRLQRIQCPGKLLINTEQPLHLLRLEADIGIHEQQVRGRWIV